MTHEEIKKIVNAHNVLQIRAGEIHRFIDITIVEVEDRFFVRPYQFAKKSWYDVFLENPTGAMKLNGQIIPVNGIAPKDLDHVNPLINDAYRAKIGDYYDTMRKGFDTSKHEARTIELIPVK